MTAQDNTPEITDVDIGQFRKTIDEQEKNILRLEGQVAELSRLLEAVLEASKEQFPEAYELYQQKRRDFSRGEAR